MSGEVTPLDYFQKPATKFITGQVYAYVNHGRWIADCCRDYCNNAYALERNQLTFFCNPEFQGCGMEAAIIWPLNVEEITAALSARPVPATRNWFPSGHELALRSGCAHGQTPRELMEEQMEMEGK